MSTSARLDARSRGPAARTEPDDRYDAICDDGNLSRRQLLIWAGNRLAPDVPVFTEGGLLHIYGHLDPGAFARAFQGVLDESDALRMVIDEVDGWPRQRERAHVDFDVELVDVSSRAQSSRRLAALVEERFAMVVGGDGPLFDTVLVRLRPDHHVWLLVQHQLVSDAWSFGLVHRRLTEHYRGALTGDVVADVTRPQFRDYLAFERRYRVSPQGRTARTFWHGRGTTSATHAVGVNARVGRDGTRIQRSSCVLGTDVSAAIRRLAAAEAASVDTGLFGFFGSLVAAHFLRTSGTREVVLNVPFANRPSQRFKHTIGTFMSVCPVRVRVDPDDTFLEVVRRLEAEMWEAARHQAYPVRHVDADQPYDVLVNVHKQAVVVRGFAGLPTEVELVAPTHRFGALSIAIRDFNAAGSLTLDFDFNAAIFGGAERDETRSHLLRLLAGFLADPTRRLGDPAALLSGPAGDGSSARTSLPVTNGRAAFDVRDDVERAVTAIWCQLLEVSVVGAEDDFFALGGDSLLAYRMLTRVRAELLTVVSPAAFFENPTVAYLINAITNGDLALALHEIDGLSEEEARVALGSDLDGPTHGRGHLDG